MISNLRVDIIYYKTSSDFELEFNLNGCCRMRILSENVSDRKSLVTALARDVNRSRVILVVSDLTGDKNGAETVSAAIGYKYNVIDKTAYKIKSDETIKAPESSLPLVSKSGRYGGCIIECGNQSIIIVSSDRALRHEIMRTYIHQYIFDVNQVEAHKLRMQHEQNPIIVQSNIINSTKSSDIPEDISSSSDNALVSDEGGVEVEASSDITLPSTSGGENADEMTAEPSEQSTLEVTETADNLSENTEEDTDVADEDTTEVTENQSEDESADSEEGNKSADNSDDSKEENVEPNFKPIIKSSKDGFQTLPIKLPKEVVDDVPSKTDKPIRRKAKGTNIALLVIAILLLVCFGVLAYFFVYKPIIDGELPNDITNLISEVISWNQ